jgi:hypothetical protein
VVCDYGAAFWDQTAVVGVVGGEGVWDAEVLWGLLA